VEICEGVGDGAQQISQNFVILSEAKDLFFLAAEFETGLPTIRSAKQRLSCSHRMAPLSSN
jgi:hypothetical protein